MFSRQSGKVPKAVLLVTKCESDMIGRTEGMSILRKAVVLVCLTAILVAAFSPSNSVLLAACIVALLVFGLTLLVRPAFNRFEKICLPQVVWITTGGPRAPPLG